MSFNDSLSDMLTRIRNAHRVNRSITYCFSSNLNNNVLKVLMVMETYHWALKNKLFFQKLTTIKLIKSVV